MRGSGISGLPPQPQEPISASSSVAIIAGSALPPAIMNRHLVPEARHPTTTTSSGSSSSDNPSASIVPKQEQGLLSSGHWSPPPTNTNATRRRTSRSRSHSGGGSGQRSGHPSRYTTTTHNTNTASTIPTGEGHHRRIVINENGSTGGVDGSTIRLGAGRNEGVMVKGKRTPALSTTANTTTTGTAKKNTTHHNNSSIHCLHSSGDPNPHQGESTTSTSVSYASQSSGNKPSHAHESSTAGVAARRQWRLRALLHSTAPVLSAAAATGSSAAYSSMLSTSTHVPPPPPSTIKGTPTRHHTSVSKTHPNPGEENNNSFSAVTPNRQTMTKGEKLLNPVTSMKGEGSYGGGPLALSDPPSSSSFSSPPSLLPPHPQPQEESRHRSSLQNHHNLEDRKHSTRSLHVREELAHPQHPQQPKEEEEKRGSGAEGAPREVAEGCVVDVDWAAERSIWGLYLHPSVFRLHSHVPDLIKSFRLSGVLQNASVVIRRYQEELALQAVAEAAEKSLLLTEEEQEEEEEEEHSVSKVPRTPSHSGVDVSPPSSLPLPSPSLPLSPSLAYSSTSGKVKLPSSSGPAPSFSKNSSASFSAGVIPSPEKDAGFPNHHTSHNNSNNNNNSFDGTSRAVASGMLRGELNVEEMRHLVTQFLKPTVPQLVSYDVTVSLARPGHASSPLHHNEAFHHNRRHRNTSAAAVVSGGRATTRRATQESRHTTPADRLQGDININTASLVKNEKNEKEENEKKEEEKKEEEERVQHWIREQMESEGPNAFECIIMSSSLISSSLSAEGSAEGCAAMHQEREGGGESSTPPSSTMRPDGTNDVTAPAMFGDLERHRAKLQWYGRQRAEAKIFFHILQDHLNGCRRVAPIPLHTCQLYDPPASWTQVHCPGSNASSCPLPSTVSPPTQQTPTRQRQLSPTRALGQMTTPPASQKFSLFPSAISSSSNTTGGGGGGGEVAGHGTAPNPTDNSLVPPHSASASDHVEFSNPHTYYRHSRSISLPGYRSLAASVTPVLVAPGQTTASPTPPAAVGHHHARTLSDAGVVLPPRQPVAVAAPLPLFPSSGAATATHLSSSSSSSAAYSTTVTEQMMGGFEGSGRHLSPFLTGLEIALSTMHVGETGEFFIGPDGTFRHTNAEEGPALLGINSHHPYHHNASASASGWRSFHSASHTLGSGSGSGFPVAGPQGAPLSGGRSSHPPAPSALGLLFEHLQSLVLHGRSGGVLHFKIRLRERLPLVRPLASTRLLSQFMLPSARLKPSEYARVMTGRYTTVAPTPPATSDIVSDHGKDTARSDGVKRDQQFLNPFYFWVHSNLCQQPARTTYHRWIAPRPRHSALDNNNNNNTEHAYSTGDTVGLGTIHDPFNPSGTAAAAGGGGGGVASTRDSQPILAIPVHADPNAHVGGVEYNGTTNATAALHPRRREPKPFHIADDDVERVVRLERLAQFALCRIQQRIRRGDVAHPPCEGEASGPVDPSSSSLPPAQTVDLHVGGGRADNCSTTCSSSSPLWTTKERVEEDGSLRVALLTAVLLELGSLHTYDATALDIAAAETIDGQLPMVYSFHSHRLSDAMRTLLSQKLRELDFKPYTPQPHHRPDLIVTTTTTTAAGASIPPAAPGGPAVRSYQSNGRAIERFLQAYLCHPRQLGEKLPGSSLCLQVAATNPLNRQLIEFPRPKVWGFGGGGDGGAAAAAARHVRTSVFHTLRHTTTISAPENRCDGSSQAPMARGTTAATAHSDFPHPHQRVASLASKSDTNVDDDDDDVEGHSFPPPMRQHTMAQYHRSHTMDSLEGSSLLPSPATPNPPFSAETTNVHSRTMSGAAGGGETGGGCGSGRGRGAATAATHSSVALIDEGEVAQHTKLQHSSSTPPPPRTAKTPPPHSQPSLMSSWSEKMAVARGAANTASRLAALGDSASLAESLEPPNDCYYTTTAIPHGTAMIPCWLDMVLQSTPFETMSKVLVHKHNVFDDMQFVAIVLHELRAEAMEMLQQLLVTISSMEKIYTSKKRVDMLHRYRHTTTLGDTFSRGKPSHSGPTKWNGAPTATTMDDTSQSPDHFLLDHRLKRVPGVFECLQDSTVTALFTASYSSGDTAESFSPPHPICDIQRGPFTTNNSNNNNNKKNNGTTAALASSLSMGETRQKGETLKRGAASGGSFNAAAVTSSNSHHKDGRMMRVVCRTPPECLSYPYFLAREMEARRSARRAGELAFRITLESSSFATTEAYSGVGASGALPFSLLSSPHRRPHPHHSQRRSLPEVCPEQHGGHGSPPLPIRTSGPTGDPDNARLSAPRQQHSEGIHTCPAAPLSPPPPPSETPSSSSSSSSTPPLAASEQFFCMNPTQSLRYVEELLEDACGMLYYYDAHQRAIQDRQRSAIPTSALLPETGRRESAPPPSPPPPSNLHIHTNGKRTLVSSSSGAAVDGAVRSSPLHHPHTVAAAGGHNVTPVPVPVGTPTSPPSYPSVVTPSPSHSDSAFPFGLTGGSGAAGMSRGGKKPTMCPLEALAAGCDCDETGERMTIPETMGDRVLRCGCCGPAGLSAGLSRLPRALLGRPVSSKRRGLPLDGEEEVEDGENKPFGLSSAGFGDASDSLHSPSTAPLASVERTAARWETAELTEGKENLMISSSSPLDQTPSSPANPLHVDENDDDNDGFPEMSTPDGDENEDDGPEVLSSLSLSHTRRSHTWRWTADHRNDAEAVQTVAGGAPTRCQPQHCLYHGCDGMCDQHAPHHPCSCHPASRHEANAGGDRGEDLSFMSLLWNSSAPVCVSLSSLPSLTEVTEQAVFYPVPYGLSREVREQYVLRRILCKALEKVLLGIFLLTCNVNERAVEPSRHWSPRPRGQCSLCSCHSTRKPPPPPTTTTTTTAAAAASTNHHHHHHNRRASDMLSYPWRLSGLSVLLGVAGGHENLPFISPWDEMQLLTLRRVGKGVERTPPCPMPHTHSGSVHCARTNDNGLNDAAPITDICPSAIAGSATTRNDENNNNNNNNENDDEEEEERRCHGGGTLSLLEALLRESTGVAAAATPPLPSSLPSVSPAPGREIPHANVVLPEGERENEGDAVLWEQEVLWQRRYGALGACFAAAAVTMEEMSRPDRGSDAHLSQHGYDMVTAALQYLPHNASLWWLRARFDARLGRATWAQEDLEVAVSLERVYLAMAEQLSENEAEPRQKSSAVGLRHRNGPSPPSSLTSSARERALRLQAQLESLQAWVEQEEHLEEPVEE